ncbi:hypothetical protein D3C72_445090 [compost metagenome]
MKKFIIVVPLLLTGCIIVQNPVVNSDSQLASNVQVQTSLPLGGDGVPTSASPTNVVSPGGQTSAPPTASPSAPASNSEAPSSATPTLPPSSVPLPASEVPLSPVPTSPPEPVLNFGPFIVVSPLHEEIVTSRTARFVLGNYPGAKTSTLELAFLNNRYEASGVIRFHVRYADASGQFQNVELADLPKGELLAYKVKVYRDKITWPAEGYPFKNKIPDVASSWIPFRYRPQ